MRKESQEEEIHEKRKFTRRGNSREEGIHKKREFTRRGFVESVK